MKKSSIAKFLLSTMFIPAALAGSCRANPGELETSYLTNKSAGGGTETTEATETTEEVEIPEETETTEVAETTEAAKITATAEKVGVIEKKLDLRFYKSTESIEDMRRKVKKYLDKVNLNESKTLIVPGALFISNSSLINGTLFYPLQQELPKLKRKISAIFVHDFCRISANSHRKLKMLKKICPDIRILEGCYYIPYNK